MFARAAAVLMLPSFVLACSAAPDDAAARPAVDNAVQGGEWVDPGVKFALSRLRQGGPLGRPESPECGPGRQPWDPVPSSVAGDAGAAAYPGNLPKPRE